MKVLKYISPFHAAQARLRDDMSAVMFLGDCRKLLKNLPDQSIDLILTSPPYCIGKEYDQFRSVDDFIDSHRLILPEIARVTRRGGSICWQIGYHVKNGVVYPLDYPVFEILSSLDDITLRNRIVWSFGHGMHLTKRFSGRHEVILWFTKGDEYFFDLDSVRMPQKYPGKRRYKGPRKGEFSGNPKGKNPSDVWEIPNVKAGHVEKLDHPCQFPVGLADRLVRSLCPAGGCVLDPYAGTASTGVAAILGLRRFVGAEISDDYSAIACRRLESAVAGKLRFRSADRPIYIAGAHEAVAKRPAHFPEVFR